MRTQPRPPSVQRLPALGPTSLITFESAPLGSFHNYAIAPGVVINGTDGVTSADQTIVNAPYSTPDGIFGYNTTTGGNQFVQVLGGNLVFTFSPAIQSFGAYIDGIQTSAETITFSDGSAQSIAIPQPSLSNGGVAFVGFTDAGKQISTVTLNALGDIVGVDDVRYGVSVAVPEPSTFVLAGSGALAMLLAARKREGTNAGAGLETRRARIKSAAIAEREDENRRDLFGPTVLVRSRRIGRKRPCSRCAKWDSPQRFARIFRRRRPGNKRKQNLGQHLDVKNLINTRVELQVPNDGARVQVDDPHTAAQPIPPLDNGHTLQGRPRSRQTDEGITAPECQPARHSRQRGYLSDLTRLCVSRVQRSSPGLQQVNTLASYARRVWQRQPSRHDTTAGHLDQATADVLPVAPALGRVRLSQRGHEASFAIHNRQAVEMAPILGPQPRQTAVASAAQSCNADAAQPGMRSVCLRSRIPAPPKRPRALRYHP